LMLAKIILLLCYQKFMNDIIPIILFLSLFILNHKQCFKNFTDIKKSIYSQSYGI